MTVPNALTEAPGPRDRLSSTAGGPGWKRPRTAVLAVVFGVLMTLASENMTQPLSQPTVGYAADCLAVGAAVTAPGKNPDVDLFRRADARIGPLSMRRSFDPVLPADFAQSAAAGDAAAGLRSFVSWKPPDGDHRGAAAGRYDRQIAAWAKSVPRTGVFATAFHEPENDMSAADFVAFQRHVYTVVKTANPTIRFGPVYMAYWWDPRERGHYVGDPASWWPGDGYADFAGLDWYGFEPEPMTTSRSFTTWYDTVAPTGLPLVIAEYGQYFQPKGQPVDPAKEEARARAIRQDATWIFAHPQFKAWLYWQGAGDSGEWRLRDRASQLAWRSVAERGCAPDLPGAQGRPSR